MSSSRITVPPPRPFLPHLLQSHARVASEPTGTPGSVPRCGTYPPPSVRGEGPGPAPGNGRARPEEGRQVGFRPSTKPRFREAGEPCSSPCPAPCEVATAALLYPSSRAAEAGLDDPRHRMRTARWCVTVDSETDKRRVPAQPRAGGKGELRTLQPFARPPACSNSFQASPQSGSGVRP